MATITTITTCYRILFQFFITLLFNRMCGVDWLTFFSFQLLLIWFPMVARKWYWQVTRIGSPRWSDESAAIYLHVHDSQPHQISNKLCTYPCRSDAFYGNFNIQGRMMVTPNSHISVESTISEIGWNWDFFFFSRERSVEEKNIRMWNNVILTLKTKYGPQRMISFPQQWNDSPKTPGALAIPIWEG